MAEDDEVRITLRLPEDLRDRLKTATEESGRSMNAEIVDRLAKSFEGDFVQSDVLADIQAYSGELMGYVKNYTEMLRAATKRETDMQERLSRLLEALSQSQAYNERLIALIEKANDVGQKA